MGSKNLGLLKKFETGFTIVFMVFLFTLTLNVMIYLAELYSFPRLHIILAASADTPWGILTSLFVHDDEAHLSNNMITLFFFMLFLSTSNLFLSREQIKERIAKSILLMFFIPVLLNLFMIVFIDGISILGSSGMVYALEGTCLGVSTLNIFKLREIVKDKENRKRVLTESLLNLIIIVVSIVSLVSPTSFPVEGHYLVIWFHSLAFTSGFASALLCFTRGSF